MLETNMKNSKEDNKVLELVLRTANLDRLEQAILQYQKGVYTKDRKDFRPSVSTNELKTWSLYFTKEKNKKSCLAIEYLRNLWSLSNSFMSSYSNLINYLNRNASSFASKVRFEYLYQTLLEGTDSYQKLRDFLGIETVSKIKLGLSTLRSTYLNPEDLRIDISEEEWTQIQDSRNLIIAFGLFLSSPLVTKVLSDSSEDHTTEEVHFNVFQFNVASDFPNLPRPNFKFKAKTDLYAESMLNEIKKIKDLSL